MTDVTDAADSRAVTSNEGNGDDRGAEIQRRFDDLGISDREWHSTTGIDRKTLNRAIDNDPRTRSSSYTAIESWLDKLEAKFAGKAVAQESPPIDSGLIEFDITGDFGVHVVVKGPVMDADLLRRQAVEVIREIRQKRPEG